jgi:hypothetical protein
LLDKLPLSNDRLLARLQAWSSSDDQCFDLARKWLHECREHHTACRSAYDSSLRPPTRLLDVGIDINTGTDILKQGDVRLVQGASCEGPYAALSYCWGPDRDLILTHESESRLRAGIAATDFPGTLRDAVIVTRRVGVRYLWIDALCIFQDQDRPESKADWAREAGRMRDVYRGAVVTIESASASRGNEGFLESRATSRPYCALQWGSQADLLVYLRPMSDITDSQLLGTTVYTRGWTLQERLLAPRTLSFGLQQCSFECANGFKDEAGRSTALPRASEPYLSKQSMLQLRRDRGWFAVAWRVVSRALGLPAVVSLGTLWDKYPIGWSSHGVLDVPGGYWATYFDYWRGVVSQFSQRQLTNSADRLPALSGLADEVQRATGSVYVAGMWEDELITCLAWTCQYIYNQDGAYGDYAGGIAPGNFATTWGKSWPDNIRPANYVAPSWSWASVKGVISFPVEPFQSSTIIRNIAKVESVQVWPEHASDPLGSLKGGVVTLNTLFLPIPDPSIPCSKDYALNNLHSHIRKEHIRLTEDLASEFYQHHQGFDGQTFGLVQLLGRHTKHQRKSTGELVSMLLVESRGEGQYSRLCCVNITMDTLEQLEQEHFGHWVVASESDLGYKAEMQPELKRMAAMSREVADAPWERRSFSLI